MIQPASPSSKHCLHLKFVLLCWILKSEIGRTPYMKTNITTGCNYGSAQWINKNKCSEFKVTYTKTLA